MAIALNERFFFFDKRNDFQVFKSAAQHCSVNQFVQKALLDLIKGLVLNKEYNISKSFKLERG